MIRINSVKMPLEAEEQDLRNAVSKTLRIKNEDIEMVRVFKRSVDSRDKENVFFVFSLDVAVRDEKKVLKKCSSNKNVLEIQEYEYTLPENKRKSNLRPVIAGFGPAGMFAALTLARSG